MSDQLENYFEHCYNNNTLASDLYSLSRIVLFSMTVYGVLSTGDNVGVIEVVRNAETLAQIHKTRGGATAALTDKALLEWLKSHNGTDEA